MIKADIGLVGLYHMSLSLPCMGYSEVECKREAPMQICP